MNFCLFFEQWEQWLATAQWAVGSGEWAVEWGVGSGVGSGQCSGEWEEGNGWRVVGSGWRAVESRHWAKGSGECMVNRFN